MALQISGSGAPSSSNTPAPAPPAFFFKALAIRGATSQEAIWAPVSSPVSRLLNPVSMGTKREEAQPPTADMSNSLYNATRGSNECAAR